MSPAESVNLKIETRQNRGEKRGLERQQQISQMTESN